MSTSSIDEIDACTTIGADDAAAAELLYRSVIVDGILCTSYLVFKPDSRTALALNKTTIDDRVAETMDVDSLGARVRAVGDHLTSLFDNELTVAAELYCVRSGTKQTRA